MITPANLLAAEQMPHVLVIDDDERLRELLFKFLSNNGFLVTMAESAQQAREMLAVLQFDMAVCDVMMPGEDGLSLTRSLKEKGSALPVLLLTALGEVDDRITGLEAGADDYLPKPFEPKELLLRVQSILRRTAATTRQDKQDKDTILGRWRVDLQRGELEDAQTKQRQPLTQAEQALLGALLSRQGVVVSREELAELSGMDAAAERTIDVQVTRLRKKVEADPRLPKYIQTVRGKGYVLWPD